ncbi:MAG TPA: hypothetical protein DEQ30_12455, partial [Porphyromonadaceae bacterium]|nr:hypothetical protein [Porphyromonadaceae bacterium]
NAKIDKSGTDWDEIDYKSGLSIGYRFRIKKPAPQSFHYDMDLNIGAKFWKSSRYRNATDGNPYIYMSSNGILLTSVGITANYSLFNKCSVGLGMEPAYYFRPNMNEIKNKFDIPLVAKVAYDLKVVEVGIVGKYGTVNLFETEYMKSGKIREIQLSLFIPF